LSSEAGDRGLGKQTLCQLSYSRSAGPDSSVRGACLAIRSEVGKRTSFPMRREGSSPAITLVSAEGKAIRLGPRAEELDLDAPLGDAAPLADQLVEALVGEGAVALNVASNP
jgi:hypothetical protein